MTTPGTLSDAWADDQEIDFLPAAQPVAPAAQRIAATMKLVDEFAGASVHRYKHPSAEADGYRADVRAEIERCLGLLSAQPVAVPARVVAYELPGGLRVEACKQSSGPDLWQSGRTAIATALKAGSTSPCLAAAMKRSLRAAVTQAPRRLLPQHPPRSNPNDHSRPSI